MRLSTAVDSVDFRALKMNAVKNSSHFTVAFTKVVSRVGTPKARRILVDPGFSYSQFINISSKPERTTTTISST